MTLTLTNSPNGFCSQPKTPKFVVFLRSFTQAVSPFPQSIMHNPMIIWMLPKTPTLKREQYLRVHKHTFCNSPAATLLHCYCSVTVTVNSCLVSKNVLIGTDGEFQFLDCVRMLLVKLSAIWTNCRGMLNPVKKQSPWHCKNNNKNNKMRETKKPQTKTQMLF